MTTTKKISKQDVETLAKYFGVEVAAVWAVIDTECSGSGFGPDGRLKIQFEPHVFASELDKLKIENELKLVGKNQRGLKIWDITVHGITIRNGVETHNAEWQAYNIAVTVHAEAAARATSWGMGQIMGFNCRLAGFKTAQDMINSFNQSEYNQVVGMFNTIKAFGIIDELQRHDWAGFARVYNGAGYAVQGYDKDLAKYYAKRKAEI